MTGIEGLPAVAYLWAFAVIAAAGLVHGTLGLGFPLVATPLIAVVTDVKTAILVVVPPTFAVVVATVIRIGGFLATVREYWFMPLWMFAGGVLGTWLFLVIDPAPLTLLLGIGILVYLGLDLLGHGESRFVQRHRRPFGALFGFIGGIFEGTVNIAAPPLLVYFLALGLAPAALIKAISLCFGTGKAAQLGTLLIAGNVPMTLWLATVPLCVLAVLTLHAGMRIRERVDAVTYRRWLKIALAGMAAVMFVQYGKYVAAS